MPGPTPPWTLEGAGPASGEAGPGRRFGGGWADRSFHAPSPGAEIPDVELRLIDVDVKGLRAVDRGRSSELRFDWTPLEKRADMHRFVALLNTRRVCSRRRARAAADGLNQLIRQADITWYGVKLDRPD